MSLLAAGAARAQDVDRIVNGGFGTDLTGWTAAAFGTSTGTWSALDDGLRIRRA